ncbi:MAG: hypothetical protein V3R87_12975 [Dehalococcoidia bacterium]
MNIDASLVADGVELPEAWSDEQGLWWTPGCPCPVLTGRGLDLSDPQTDFGVALKLDAWEAAGGETNKVHDQNWSEGVATCIRFPSSSWSGEHMDGMHARLTHIGLDHRIRRALGWEVEPGTLATYRLYGARDWRVSHGHRTYIYGLDSLLDVTDPVEALQAIADEVADASA